jgi:hypothetical protein
MLVAELTRSPRLHRRHARSLSFPGSDHPAKRMGVALRTLSVIPEKVAEMRATAAGFERSPVTFHAQAIVPLFELFDRAMVP